MSVDSILSPVLFIPHGGGPLPLLDDPGHQALIDFLQGIPARIPTPSAICVISAHWEESTATITSNASPSLIYDYRCESTEAMRIASAGRVVPDRHAAGRVFEAKRRKPARPSHVPSSHLRAYVQPPCWG
jgi:hypothetical protein